MMKRILTFLALSALTIPIFVGAFASHDIKYSIHKSIEKSQSITDHHHHDHSHNFEDSQINKKSNHPILVGLITELNGYIKTNIKNSPNNKLKQYAIAINSHVQAFEISFKNPVLKYSDNTQYLVSYQDTYLKTSRLRI